MSTTNVMGASQPALTLEQMSKLLVMAQDKKMPRVIAVNAARRLGLKEVPSVSWSDWFALAGAEYPVGWLPHLAAHMEGRELDQLRFCALRVEVDDAFIATIESGNWGRCPKHAATKLMLALLRDQKCEMYRMPDGPHNGAFLVHYNARLSWLVFGLRECDINGGGDQDDLDAAYATYREVWKAICTSWHNNSDADRQLHANALLELIVDKYVEKVSG